MNHTIAIAGHRFVRRVLQADAASCLALGLLLVAGAGALSGPLGLSASLLFWAGALLFPCALLMLYAAQRPLPALLRLIVAGNVAWLVASIAVLELAAGLTAFGMAFVLLQAVAVAALTALEWRGLRAAG
ncbi:MAG: hypothetical protein ACOY33_09465 [Pseudomonadota bacterium]